MSAGSPPSPTDVKGGEENVALFGHVASLDCTALNGIQGAAQIAVPSFAINYNDASVEDGDYKDRVAYQATQFTDETKALEALNDLLVAGKKFVSLLYAYRSCSKALPMVQADTSEAEKVIVHQKTFAILRPEILKVKDLMEFHEKAVQIIKSNFQIVVNIDQRKEVQSDALQEQIIRAIDMLILLDALKDMRAALLNDFSRYKRAFTPIRGDLTDSDALSEEIHTLQMFLSNPQQPHNLIMFHLKTDLQKVNQYDLVLALLLQFCIESIENQRYMMPSDYHTYYRVMPYLLYIMDSDDKKGGLNVFRYQGKAKFDLEKIKKMFKSFPIIPLHNDMHIDLMYVLRRCNHWEEEKMVQEWITQRPQKLVQRYSLLYARQSIRKEYTEYTASFTSMLNEIKTYTAAKRIITPRMLSNVFSVVLQGLKLQSSWASKIHEQCAFKYARPKSDAEYKQMGGSGELGHEYEKAVKFNYDSDELYALIDVIGMLKGLGSLMVSNEYAFVPLVRRCIHDDIQIFLQQEVARPLRKAHKRNRTAVKNVMLQMREIGCDWINREMQKDDYMQKKKELLQVNRDFPRRATAPTLTQINLIRRMMHTVFSDKAAGMQGGLFTEKDLKKEWIPVWEEFYTKSFYYVYMLNISTTIRELLDLSHLWYREFYLEVTKCIQFPIAMSLPWIMTQFLISTPSMKENMFYPIDIYNDAAAAALYTLKQQFLYDEIQAELNLSFEQLVFHLSADVFKYFKTVASAILINKPYEVKYFEIKQLKASLIESRYVSLMGQKTISLLGRTVDLCDQIGEQVNNYLRNNIDFIIRKFEASELSSIVEISWMLENCKMTHQLLSDYLPLDDWETMLKEINEDIALGQFRGRIVWHVFSELTLELFPNFIFNEATQRFVRGTHTFVQPRERARMPAGIPSYYWFGRKFMGPFEKHAALYKDYVGFEHIDALIRVLSPTDWPLIIHELMQEAENKLLYDFAPYAEKMIEGIPQTRQKSMSYGIVGAYGFADVKLKNSLGNYGPLRPNAFQSLREFGNNLLFLRALETSFSAHENLDFQQQAHFLGLKHHPPRATTSQAASLNTVVQQFPFIVPEADTLTPIQTHMRGAYTHLTQTYADRLSAEDQTLMNDAVAIADESQRLYALRTEPLSYLTNCFARIVESLKRNGTIISQWRGPSGTADLVLDNDNARNVARLISCLFFIYCQPTDNFNPNKINDMAAFGDGWLYAAATILHLSGMKRIFDMIDLSHQIVTLDILQPIDRAKHSEFRNAKDKSKLKMKETDVQEATILEFMAAVKSMRLKLDSYLNHVETFYPAMGPTKFSVRPPADEKEVDHAVAAYRQHAQTVVGTIRAGPQQSAPLMSSSTFTAPNSSTGN